MGGREAGAQIQVVSPIPMLGRRMNVRRTRTALAAALALGVGVACPDVFAPAAIAAASTPAPAPAVVPPALAALEQKMALLSTRSERYEQTERGFIDVTNEVNGRPVGRTRRVSADGSATGPLQGEVVDSTRARHTRTLFAGGASYLLVPALARYDGGRPWVREPAEASAAFPYHGGGPGTVSLGGAGPYAGLLDLLASASGQVLETGSATIDGQQATGFEASVNPFELIAGLTREDAEDAVLAGYVDHLTVYLSESGLPLRVVDAEHDRHGANSLTLTSETNVLAVEVPVSVKPPPAARTIGQAAYERVLRKHPKALGVEVIETGTVAVGGEGRGK